MIGKALLYTCVETIGHAIIARDIVLAPYVYILTSDIKTVGYITAIGGVSMVVSAMPVGYLIDRYDNTNVLGLGCVLG